MGPFSVPVGKIDIGCADCADDLVDADAARRQLVGIDLNAHRGVRLAEDVDIGHAVDRRDRADNDGFGIFIDVRSGRVGEVTVIWSTAASAGLTLRIVGGVGSVGGSWRVAAEIAACTSCAAPSMLRSSRNCSVIWVDPSTLTEFIVSRPGMIEN